MNSWQIGDVRVTKFVEQETVGMAPQFIPQATPAACRDIRWLYPDFMDTDGNMRLAIQSFVMETPGCRILVDTAMGNGKKGPKTVPNTPSSPFLSDMARAGFSPDSFDYVVFTHLHIDHVGWNTVWDEGQWRPAFPRARYVVAGPEFHHCVETRASNPYGDYFANNIQPVFEAGLFDLVETNHRLCPEITLVPTPGHTPGHVSLRIASRDEIGLISGDFMHHPCQMARPHWSTTIDHDPRLAESTRRRMLARLADDRSLVIGSHFAGPGAGRVVRDGDAWRLDTAL